MAESALEPQIVGFLLWMTGFILGLSISYLIGKVVHSEEKEVRVSPYEDTRDVWERFGRR